MTYDQTDTSYEKSDIACSSTTTPKLKHDALTLNVTVEAAGEGKNKKVTIGKVAGAEYSFAGDVEGEYKSGESDNEKIFTAAEIEANPKITVAIRYPQDKKYEDVTPLTQTIDLSKETPVAPSAAIVAFGTNAGKTKYVLQITNPDGLEDAVVEYSLDGQTFKTKDEIQAMEFGANETINLYVRKQATETANASNAVLTTKTTEAASAAPTITGAEGATTFKDSLEVTLKASGTCCGQAFL